MCACMGVPGGMGERQRLCGGQVEKTGVSGGDGGGDRGKWRRQGAGESRVRCTCVGAWMHTHMPVTR